MKTCSVEGCNNKHHARGLCKKHYDQYLKEKLKNTKCCVEGCNNPICITFTKEKLCSKHGTRLARHGDIQITAKDRRINTFLEEMEESNDILNYEIKDRNAWTYICKMYYGETCVLCGWNKGNCDVHHRIPVFKGGKNTINNGIVLCPNCHRLQHIRHRPPRYSQVTLDKLNSLFNKIKKDKSA